jgi:DNA ligase-1
MNNLVKPMRAAAATDDEIETLINQFGQMIASPKLDGIRCSIQHKKVLTKSLKRVPNLYVQKNLADIKLHGYDGELIVGSPTAHDVYRTTNSGVMRIKEEPDFQLYVFDDCVRQYPYRIRRPTESYNHPFIKIVEHMIIESMHDMYAYEKSCLDQGYEGIVLRDPTAMYKNGKSTAKQGGSVKVKRFTDGEAIIESMEELMHNDNEATTNELGRTQRSSRKENKRPAGTMGKIICKDVETGVEVKIGTGFSAKERQEMWNNQSRYIGVLWKYKSFKIGVKDKPRHSVSLGPRHPSDM